MRRSGWHDWRLELGVLLTLLAWGGIAPRTHAGCGESTVVIWPTAPALHQAESASASEAVPHSLPVQSVPGRRPCSGPHCSRLPLLPPTPPATSPAPNPEWACLAVLPSDTDLPGSAHLPEEDSQTPIFRKYRIYHPPR